LYDHGRFFTITGDVFAVSTTVVDLPAAAVSLYRFAKPKAAKQPKSGGNGQQVPRSGSPKFTASDQDVFKAIGRSKAAPKIRSLWAGRWQGMYGSWSSADQALCNYLAFYCGPGNEAQVERLFLRSKLGQRPKATSRVDYVRRTVDSAYAGRTDFYRWNRQEIVITTDEHLVVDQALEAIKHDDALFQRGNVLATVTRASAAGKQKGVVERPDGSVQIATMPKAMLRRLMSTHAAWVTYRVDRRRNSVLVPAHVPGWAVDQLWDLRRWPGVRHLEGIIEAPTMRPDGSLPVDRGYDDQTGLLYLPSGDFPGIPENPDRLEAMSAAADLLAVVNDFPFASEGHRHAYLAALITPLVRFAIEGPCPLFLLDANVAGSGKTKLCDFIAILATGRTMPRSRYQSDDAEMDKTMLSIALAGDRLMLFDNVPGGFSIGGGSLDAALTGFTVKGRILGESRMSGDVPITTVFYATGNNLGLPGDALRRVVPARLESLYERPEERTDYKIKNLLGYVSAERARLVAAALTLCVPTWSLADLIRDSRRWITRHGAGSCVTRWPEPQARIHARCEPS
jgi:hypothetical protein